MKARTTVWVVCLLIYCIPRAQGADPSPGALLRRVSTIRLEVAGGRIVSPALGRAASRSFTADQGEVKESLSINLSGEEPSLSYRYLAAGREWTFDLHGNGEVVLRDISKAESITYEQRSGQVKLTIENSQLPKYEVRGRTLWHLLAFSPEGETLLLPHLEALRPGWGLAKKTGEIKALLVTTGGADGLRRRVEWQQCVAQLGDAEYEVRRSADRKLRSGGSSAAAFLQTLDGSRLEPEQNRRVARIIAATAQEIDEPSSVAAAWAYDAEVWCCLLRDENVRGRGAAADHLARLLGRPLNFDPAAEGPMRSAQARAIEESLLRR